MSEPRRTVGDVCGMDKHASWMKDALKRPNLCARCNSITADAQCLQQAQSTEGFSLQVPLRILHDSAETGSCRMCSIFLCITLHSLLDEAIFSWPVAKFLDAHIGAVASLKARALLQPEGLRKSANDVHELLVYGEIVGVDIPAGRLMDQHLRFKIYASPDDRAAGYISSLAYDRDMQSNAAFSKIRSWVSNCDTHHSSCPRPKPALLPTRVLDLSNQDNASTDTVRLHVTQGEWGQYAALSYCWGGGQQFRTAVSSVDDARTRIEMSSLPLTIQDAIIVARQIGLKYLWVDALCIIQDSVEDRDAEIGRMAETYLNSCLTIIAASANGSNKGFLAPKDSPRSQELVAVPYQFDIPIACPGGGVDVVGAEYCLWDNKVSPEPLDHRAWAYQEYILSRRAIIYGTSTLTWRCEQGIQTWNSWLRGHQKIMTEVLLPADGGQDLYKETWKGVVALYGRRHLTLPEDKLPAISALASSVLNLSIKNGGEPGRYLAGIWENDILDQLIWLVNLEQSRDVRCIVYRAPSWSWASVECQIIFPTPRNGLTPSEIESASGTELEIIDCKVTPRSSLTPLGQVTGGQLRVRGYLVHGACVPEPETWQLGTFKGKNRDVVLKLDCYGVGDLATTSKAQSCWWLRVQHHHGLVLELADGEIYRRVGCVIVKDWSRLSGTRRDINII